MKKKNSGFFYQSTNGKFLIGFLLFSNPLRDVIGEGDKLRDEFCFRGVEQVSKKGFKRGEGKLGKDRYFLRSKQEEGYVIFNFFFPV